MEYAGLKNQASTSSTRLSGKTKQMQSKPRRIQSLSRNCSKRFDFDAARDFEMGQDWQSSEQALDHHADIRARFRRGDNYEIVALIHALPDRNRCLFSATFNQRWVECLRCHRVSSFDGRRD